MDNKTRWQWTPCQIFFSLSLIIAIILTFISSSLGLFHFHIAAFVVDLYNLSEISRHKKMSTYHQQNKQTKIKIAHNELIKILKSRLVRDKKHIWEFQGDTHFQVKWGRVRVSPCEGLTPECESVKWSAGTTRPSPEVTGERTKSGTLARPPPSQI